MLRPDEALDRILSTMADVKGPAGLVVEPLRTQVSGHHSSATGHHALAILTAGSAHLPAGTRVTVRVLRPLPVATCPAPAQASGATSRQRTNGARKET